MPLSCLVFPGMRLVVPCMLVAASDPFQCPHCLAHLQSTTLPPSSTPVLQHMHGLRAQVVLQSQEPPTQCPHTMPPSPVVWCQAHCTKPCRSCIPAMAAVHMWPMRHECRAPDCQGTEGSWGWGLWWHEAESSNACPGAHRASPPRRQAGPPTCTPSSLLRCASQGTPGQADSRTISLCLVQSAVPDIVMTNR